MTETFAIPSSANSHVPMVTVTKNRMIGFNAAALTLLDVRPGDYVPFTLGFDRDQARIVITRNSAGDGERQFWLSAKKGKWPAFCARLFFQWIQVFPQRTMRFRLERGDGNFFFCITEPFAEDTA